MNQEDKELLLKDLCSRLPYGIICKYWAKDYAKDCGDFINEDEGKIESISFTNREVVIGFTCVDLDTNIIKPYLRPMSSMTEEEKEEVSILLNYEFYIDDDYALVAEDDRHRIRLDLMQVYIDWLNAHHFDYRGLIPMGLAIEVTEENNPYKK